MSIESALLRLRPGAKWALYGNDYSALVWMDDSTKPTRDEVEAVLAANLEPVPEPITEVPAWRIHALLDRTGLTNTVAGMLEALPVPARFDAKAQFQYATKFEADNPFVRAAAEKLGLSVQEFFQEALTAPGSEVADLTDPGLIDRIKAWWNT
jgi:hypothetical protein